MHAGADLSAPPAPASVTPVSPTSTGTPSFAGKPPRDDAPPAPDKKPLVVDETGLHGPFSEGLRRALRQDARALLADPEEFSCTLSLLVDGGLESVAECSLEVYAEAQPALERLDGAVVEEGGQAREVHVYTAVTDLGRRVVAQLFALSCDSEVASDIRKANARAINRLRPGTSLTRHNRARLQAALARAGAREGPSFLECLEAEGVTAVDADGGTLSLDEAIVKAVLPRKAVARALGAYLDLPFVDVEENLPRAHGGLFGRGQILAWEAIPCGESDEGVEVAMADPTDQEAISAMVTHLGRPVLARVAAATDIRVAADKLFRHDEDA